MQSRMAILIAYCIGMKKDHQTLLNFAILAGKRQKRIFSCKVVLKNFHGRAKGGHRTVALPLNTPLDSDERKTAFLTTIYSKPNAKKLVKLG